MHGPRTKKSDKRERTCPVRRYTAAVLVQLMYGVGKPSDKYGEI